MVVHVPSVLAVADGVTDVPTEVARVVPISSYPAAPGGIVNEPSNNCIVTRHVALAVADWLRAQRLTPAGMLRGMPTAKEHLVAVVVLALAPSQIFGMITIWFPDVPTAMSTSIRAAVETTISIMTKQQLNGVAVISEVYVPLVFVEPLAVMVVPCVDAGNAPTACALQIE
jgi:hypothetical protein